MRASSARGQDYEALARRRTVAIWIENVTGVPIPTSSDFSFRSALKDGVLLCRLMNRLVPYSIPKVIEQPDDSIGCTEQVCQNMDNFLTAAEKFGMPSESLFSIEDVMDGTWEDRPKVAECLYQLERIAEQMGVPNDPAAGMVNGDLLFSPYGGGAYSVGSPDPYDQYSLMNGAPENLRQLGSWSPGLEGGLMDKKTKGISKLMEQCTSILRDRMWHEGMASPQSGRRTHSGLTSPAGAPPAGDQGALRSLQSMLEQVLDGITLAQERQSRTGLEQMEKYTRSLEQQIDLLQSQPPVCDGGYMPEDVEAIQRVAEDLSRKLDEYEKTNMLLESKLESEKEEKSRLALQMDELRTQVDSVANMHSKYSEIQDENRKLYNMVQDLRGNIRVFCRVRPLGVTGDGTGSCVEVGTEGEVAIQNTKGNDKRKIFKFDKVFEMGSTQDEVYSETQPLIRSVLDGYNVCIFAYGQTGSGKTHTMSGTDVEEYEGRGINYRALDDLFQIKKDRADEVDYDIRVQMLEIYNEVLRDLLTRDSSKKNRLEIMSTEKSGENVPEATQISVDCTEDVLNFMEIGARNRAVGSTKMNERSSRSHSVLTVIVDGNNRRSGVRSHACLHLVDLAGSERVARSEASGERLEEAKHINKSLSALGDVMSALAQKSSHVPYRNSKLTQLLQDSLSGQAKAMMFMHIAPEASSRGETLSTLMFGARVSQVTLGQARQNTESSKIFEARDAIQRLQQKAEKRQEKIQELEKVVETERAVARSAISEKEAMEKEMAALREELNLTRRSMASCSSDAPSLASLDRKRDPAHNGQDVESAAPSHRVNRMRRFGSSETALHRPGTDRPHPFRESSRREPMPRPSLSHRSSSRNSSASRSSDTGATSLRQGQHSRSISAINVRAGASRASRSTTGDRSTRNIAGDRSARRGPQDSARYGDRSNPSSHFTGLVRKAQHDRIRTTHGSMTARELTKPKTNASINPRRVALTRQVSNASSSSAGLSARGSARGGGGWR